jgi:hypothetical protein
MGMQTYWGSEVGRPQPLLASARGASPRGTGEAFAVRVLAVEEAVAVLVGAARTLLAGGGRARVVAKDPQVVVEGALGQAEPAIAPEEHHAALEG